MLWNLHMNSACCNIHWTGINILDKTCHYRVMWLSALMVYVLVVKEQSHSDQMSELPSTSSLVKSKGFFLF